VRLGRIGFWYRFAVVLIKPVLLVLTRRRWIGLENVPRTGGVIIAVNHISHADPLPFADAMLYGVGRPPRFLAKSTLFLAKNPFRWLVATVLKGTGQIPVHRGTTSAADSLVDAVAALQRGELVCIYPEGTVSRDPEKWPMSAKTGIARLALESGAPVVPVAQWGAQEILDSYRTKGLHLLPRHTITVVAGPPVDLSRWQGRPQTADVLRGATSAVMADITHLLEGVRGGRAPERPYEFHPQSRRTA